MTTIKMYKPLKWHHVVLVIIAMFFVAMLITNKASAWSLDRGFFTNRTDFEAYNYCSGGNTWVHHVVICGGLDNSSSKAVFIKKIRDTLEKGSVSDKVGASAIDTLEKGSVSDKVGASAIVYLMLGYSNGSGLTVPVATDSDAYKDWEARVKNPAVTLSVDESYYYELNSALVSMNPADDEFDLVFYKPGAGTYPALVFKAGGEEVFAIKLKCANPVGKSLKKLPPAVPPDHLPTFKLKAYCDHIRITNLKDQDRPGGKVWVEIYPKTAVTEWNVQFNGTRDIAIKDLSQVLTKQTITVVAFSIDSAGNEVSGSATTITDDVGPCPNTASCIIPSLPVAIPNQLYTINLQIKLAAWSSPPYSDSGSGTPEMRVTITPPAGGGATKSFTAGYATNGASLNTILTSKNIDFTPTMSGLYVVNWGISALGINCQTTFISGDQPYFQVYGGDIIAGISLGSPPSTPPSANILSWNQDSGSYGGAGSQLAAIATGDIKSFVTAQGGTNPSQPSGLSFANTTASGTTYGGGFTSLPASDSYHSLAESQPHTDESTSTINLGSLSSGVYHHTGAITIDAPSSPSVTIGASTSITIYTDGDVYINDNILYNYSNLSEIPRLNIYTTGNIIVGKDVTELHGVFVAEGGSSKFYSCGVGVGSTTPVGYIDAGTYYNDCNKQLTIYGSVVAQELILTRTYGSLGGAVDEPAEKFKHSPETWLGGRPSAGGGGPTSGANSFDYYVSLPPVL